MEDMSFCGGTADTHKLFDKILRPVVYKMAELAGMPRRVLNAYRSSMEYLRIYNTTAGWFGHSCQKRRGIPHGCPFSMMCVALFMRLLICRIKVLGVMPQVLADDVVIVVKGSGMLGRGANTLNEHHQYSQAMGARAAPAKSYNCASCERAR